MLGGEAELEGLVLGGEIRPRAEAVTEEEGLPLREARLDEVEVVGAPALDLCRDYPLWRLWPW